MIRFENVSKHFVKGRTRVQALDSVSFEVPAGALALVRGPSGSGKSTLINLASGLMRPTSGSVTVVDQRVDQIPAGACTALRATRVAVVFQLFHLVPYLTAVENVLLPTLSLGAKPESDAGARAEELLRSFGLEQRMGHYPDEMSAGERQRCALARALFNDPEVILADEPTGNLDPASADRVLQALEERRQAGVTILLVSHRPEECVNPDLEFNLVEGKLEG